MEGCVSVWHQISELIICFLKYFCDIHFLTKSATDNLTVAMPMRIMRSGTTNFMLESALQIISRAFIANILEGAQNNNI